MGLAADSASGSREQFMRVALEMAERGMAAGGPPVGACLVKNGAVVTAAANSVIGDLDITAHAEIAVLRLACRELRTLDLSDATLFVTVEPCPMCLAACHYAGIGEICFGAPIAAMHEKTGNELRCGADGLFINGERQPDLHGGVLADECAALLALWRPPGGGRKS
jgi:tRNA(Arg) A34 adenosine deaminase TadA